MLKGLPTDLSPFTELEELELPEGNTSLEVFKKESFGDAPGSSQEESVERKDFNEIRVVPASASAQDIADNFSVKSTTNTGNSIIIGTEEQAKAVKELDGDLPIVGVENAFGILKKEEIAKSYGIDFTDTSGSKFFSGLLIDRLILAPRRGRSIKYNLVTSGLDRGSNLYSYASSEATSVYVQSSVRAKDTSVDGNTVTAHIHNSSVNINTESVIMRRALLDHVPFATNPELQSVLNLLVSADVASAFNLSIGAVRKNTDGSSVEAEKGLDVEKALSTISKVLEGNNVRHLALAKPEIYKQINAELSSLGSEYGQLVPSMYDLLRQNLIDLDAVLAVQKRLHEGYFPGFSRIVTDFIPKHLTRVAETLSDSPNKVAQELFGINTKKTPGEVEFLVNTSGQRAVNQKGERVREGDLQETNKRREELDKHYMGMYLFNGQKLSLSSPEHGQELADIAGRFMREQEVPVILPAYKEPSAADVARAASKVAPKRVILASPDMETLTSAAKHCIAIDQNKVFEHVDFARLVKEGILPNDRKVTLRGKGMTLLAGTLYGMAKGLVKMGGYMSHVDTDIINMDDDGHYYQGAHDERESYRPLEYMALSHALMPVSHRALCVQPSKVGPNRKNEVKFPTFQSANNSQDQLLNQVGLGLGRVGWPSPGEAMVVSDLYLKTPWQVTTGFDLNRYLTAIVWENVVNGKISQEAVKDVFAQVLIQADKIEAATVPEKNDILEVVWADSVIENSIQFYRELLTAQQTQEAILGRLEGKQREALEGALKPMLNPALTPDWEIDHIARFNEQRIGEMRVMSSEYPESQRLDDASILYPESELFRVAGGPNTAAYRNTPFYIPSVDWLLKNDYIDLDAIASIKPVEYVGRKSYSAYRK